MPDLIKRPEGVFEHSVTLNRARCKGCTHCIKRCPTEAIRIRAGKAKIITERCIDCGECIRVCPYHAKQAVIDHLDVMENYKYNIALPAPALYGQFNNLDDVDIILNALLAIGFDEVFEVAKAAEIISDATRQYLNRPDIKKPVISSACPSVLRLLRVRFPELLPHLLPYNAPVELAARLAKREAIKKTGLAPEEIGIIFISPCPAKMTAATRPVGINKSEISAVVAIRDVYPILVTAMEKLEFIEKMSSTGRMGIGWGASGGEASAVLKDRYMAADGMENIINALEDMENDKFQELDFVELMACPGGCVGGVLTVENPHIAKAKLKRISKHMPISQNRYKEDMKSAIERDNPITFAPVLQLSSDRATAIQMLAEMRQIESRLFGIDCGSCGAPTCHAYAEDVVKGFATEDGCIYRLREKVQKLSEQMAALAATMPRAMYKSYDRPLKKPIEKKEEPEDE